MVSAHSNIHRLLPRLRLVIDNADPKAEVDADLDVGGSQKNKERLADTPAVPTLG